MTNGGTVEELDAQVDALVSAIVAHNALIQTLEQDVVADTYNHRDRQHTLDAIATHRQIVDEHAREVRLLRDEILLLIPEPRQP